MKKRWVIFTIGILGMLMLSYFGILKLFRETPSSQQAPNKSGDSYFDLIPITKWTDYQCPCLPIQINTKDISSQLDLGFRGHFSIASEVLEQIEEKAYLGSQTMYGLRGKQYEKKVFEIPEVRIGCTTFYRHEIQEEAPEFSVNGTILKDEEAPSPTESGRIGWKIFQATNLFLDLGNDTIAFCHSLATLKTEGYAVESFTKTPLISERGFIEIDAKTTDGCLRCVLDTGCTLSFFNTEAEAGQSLEELMRNPENAHEISLFNIAEKEFGPITFHRIPIQLPIHVEAILGMDFFKKNLVFLDFANNLVYFAPSKKQDCQMELNQGSDGKGRADISAGHKTEKE